LCRILGGNAAPAAAAIALQDISSNNFTGQLPASEHWGQLTIYHANNNRFAGTMPRALCQHAHLLRDLDISNNEVGVLRLVLVSLLQLVWLVCSSVAVHG
jgi:hypothetical protein